MFELYANKTDPDKKATSKRQVESMIEGLEDATHTLKERSDAAFEIAQKDLDLSLENAKELDQVPSKYVRKKDIQATTEKLKAQTATAKQEVDCTA
jgi:hypothetical protein